jgi:hypothetical protein
MAVAKIDIDALTASALGVAGHLSGEDRQGLSTATSP